MTEDDIVNTARIMLAGNREGKILCDFFPTDVHQSMNVYPISYKGNTFSQQLMGNDVTIIGKGNGGDYNELIKAMSSGKRIVLVELE